MNSRFVQKPILLRFLCSTCIACSTYPASVVYVIVIHRHSLPTTPTRLSTNVIVEITRLLPVPTVPGHTRAGKSTLGNLLLYGTDEVEGGFVVGHGSHSETMECRKKVVQVGNEHSLHVIDTPGVPDTDPKKTLGGYDKIIEHVRRSPAINAIIILVAPGRVEARDYRNYRTLLRQFNALPCPKILVTRVEIKESWSVQRKEIKYTAAKELMDNIERHAKLENVERFILHDTNEDNAQVLREIVCNMPSTDLARATLRTYNEMKLIVCNMPSTDLARATLRTYNEMKLLVCNMPSTDLARPTLRTYNEMKFSYERLSQINMRRHELQAEGNRLGEEKRQNEKSIICLRNRIQSLERKKSEMNGLAVVDSATLIGLAVAIFGFSKTEEGAAETRVATLTKEIQARKAEMRSRAIDQIELHSVKVELKQLQSLMD